MKYISNESAAAGNVKVKIVGGKYDGQPGTFKARHGSPHVPYSTTEAVVFDVKIRGVEKLLRVPGRRLERV